MLPESTIRKYLLAIDDQIIEAGKIMSLDDLSDDEKDGDDFDTIYEERFHCGVCVTRTVMDTVYPSISAYYDFLEESYNKRDEALESAWKFMHSIIGSLEAEKKMEALAMMADMRALIDGPAEEESNG